MLSTGGGGGHLNYPWQPGAHPVVFQITPGQITLSWLFCLSLLTCLGLFSVFLSPERGKSPAFLSPLLSAPPAIGISVIVMFQLFTWRNIYICAYSSYFDCACLFGNPLHPCRELQNADKGGSATNFLLFQKRTRYGIQLDHFLVETVFQSVGKLVLSRSCSQKMKKSFHGVKKGYRTLWDSPRPIQLPLSL